MAYAELVVADGAVAYWRLGETSGTTAVDEIAGANGTISIGVTLNQLGALPDGNKAMAFNGTTGKIRTPSRTLAATFTLEAWIRTTVALQSPVCSNRELGNGPYFGLNGSGQLYLYITFGVSGGPVLTDNIWHHIVATFNGTTSILYLDGAQIASGDQVYSGQTTPFEIAHDVANDQFFTGFVDDVAIYPTALTPTQIAAHYAAAAPVDVRLTQVYTEALTQNPSAAIRLTSAIVEVLSTVAAVTTADVRLTQAYIEALTQNPPPADVRLTSAIVEVLGPSVVPFEHSPLAIGLTYMQVTTRSGAIHAWSDRPLPDPAGYECGWKAPRVLEWGRIRRALSGFDGQYETSDFVVTLDDTDRVLRELDNDRELVNATVIVKMIPDDDRRLELPWATVYRGVIRDARPLGTLRYEMTIKDPFAESFAIDANPVPLRTITQADFPYCATTNVGSSATGYTAGGAAAGAETMTVSGGTGTFVNGDVITFAGHATLYTISDQTTDDPETAITFSPALTAAVGAGEAIAVRAKYQVTPANGRRVPFWYGHITDRVVIDGIDQSDGQGPVIYVGDRQLPDGHTYGEFLWAGHACYSATPIPMLYFWNESLDDLAVGIPGVNDLATEAGTGGRIALPGFANWSDNGFTTPYVDYNGRRYTVLFLRGFYRDWALGIRQPPPNLGGVPFAVEAYGCETVGDGSGALILDGLAQYLHILQNWTAPRGTGYQSGPWLSTLTFIDDPSVTMIDEPSFATAQAQSAVYTAALGEPAGVRGDFGVGVNDQAIRVRDLLARLNVSFGVEAGFSKHAQYFVTMPNRDISTITLAAPLGWERDIFEKTFAIDAQTRDLFTSLGLRHTQDFFNRVSGGWRSIAVDEPSTFTDQVVTNSEAVTAYGADTVYHDVLLYMVRGKNRIGDPPEYARGSTTAEVVMTLKLARTSWVQHIAKLQTGPAGFDYELGDILAITHYEGLSETGWAAYPVRVERIEIDPSTYTTVLETFAYASMLLGGPFNPNVFNPDVFNT
jgi:hypothetical protein